jgi:alpha-galactosidase
VVIGAGSASFGPRIIADVLTHPDLKGSTIALVDIAPQGLKLIAGLAKRMNSEWGCGLKIEATTDRKRALPEAEFVIVAIALEREKRWRMDWEIPLKHGLRQPLGENGGPAAFAHAARNIPPVLEICADMRKLCPDAWFFNFTNPVPRIALTAYKYGGVKAAGFCHQIGAGFGNISRLLDIPREDLDLKTAGLNHFTWVLDVRKKSTGQDLYPALRRRLRNWPKDFQPLTRDVFQDVGLFPVGGDGHMDEYLPWVCDPRTKPWEKYNLHLYNWDGAAKGRDAMWKRIEKMVAGKEPIEDYRRGSGERAIPVLVAIVKDSNSYELSVNIPNEGYITNLPHRSIVEVPAVVSGMGIRGVAVGDLPEPAGELCRRQVTVAELAVEAAVKGDRTKALHAILMDPMITDIQQARGILDDYLRAHAPLLPQFRRAARRRAG